MPIGNANTTPTWLESDPGHKPETLLPTTILLLVAARDADWHKRVVVHLTPWTIDCWHDERGSPGLERRAALQRAVERGVAVVVLVSADLLASRLWQDAQPALWAARGRSQLLPLSVSAHHSDKAGVLREIQPLASGAVPLEAQADSVLVQLRERIAALPRITAPSPGAVAASASDSDNGLGYQPGSPILVPRRFFGRTMERRRILKGLAQTPSLWAMILGCKRSGKTSLLHYLLRRPITAPVSLREDQRDDCPVALSHHRFVLVDFQDPRNSRRDTVLLRILEKLGWPGGPVSSVDLDDFMSRMEHLREPSVIMMDEVGLALRYYQHELDLFFWNALRALAQVTMGKLAFVVAAHDDPQRQRMPGSGSPFFNCFGLRHHLKPLTEAEARQLIASGDRTFSVDDVAWIVEHSERWPHLLQIACTVRLSALEEGIGWREDALAALDEARQMMVD